MVDQHLLCETIVTLNWDGKIWYKIESFFQGGFIVILTRWFKENWKETIGSTTKKKSKLKFTWKPFTSMGFSLFRLFLFVKNNCCCCYCCNIQWTAKVLILQYILTISWILTNSLYQTIRFYTGSAKYLFLLNML